MAKETPNLDFLEDDKNIVATETIAEETVAEETNLFTTTEVRSSDGPENIYDSTGLKPNILTSDDDIKIEEAGLSKIVEPIVKYADPFIKKVLKIDELFSSRANDIEKQSADLALRKNTGGDVTTQSIKTGLKGNLVPQIEIKDLDNNMKVLNLPSLKLETKEDIKKLFDNVGFNADGSYNSIELDKIINEQFANVLDAAKGKTTNLRILAYASNMGLDEIVMEIRNLKPNQVLDSKSFVAAGLKADLIQTRIKVLLNADNMKELQSPEDILEIQKLMMLLGELRVSGRETLSEYGRGLQAEGLVQNSKQNGIIDDVGLSDLMESNSFSKDIAPEDWQIIRLQLDGLSDDPSKLRKAAKEATKLGLSGNWLRYWSQINVNGMLSNPMIAQINVLSGLGFQSLRNGEYYLAAGLNNIFYKNSPEGVTFRGAFAHTSGVLGGISDGLSMMYKSIFNTPDSTKVDYFAGMFGGTGKNNYAKTELLMPSLDGTIIGKALDYGLSVTNLYTKGIVLGDQFIKGWSRKQTLNFLANKEMEIAISKGLGPADAKKLRDDIKLSPPDYIVEQLETDMLRSTFQTYIPNEAYQAIRRFSNTPIIKSIQPFTNALANISREAFIERTPAGYFVSKNMKSKLLGKQGKHQQQLAQSQVLLGTSVMGSFIFSSFGQKTIPYTDTTFNIGEVDYNSDIIITGNYPPDKKSRETWQRLGIPAGSFGFKQDDGKYKWRSYQGLGEPLNKHLMLAADFGHAHSRPGSNIDDKEVEEFFFMFGGNVAEMIKNEAYLQSAVAVGHMLNSSPSEGENIFNNLLTTTANNIGSSLVNFIGAPVINMGGVYPSGFARWRNQRKGYDYVNVMATEGQINWAKDKKYNWFGDLDSFDIEPWVNRGYEIINRIYSNSGWVDVVDLNLNKRKNIWNEVMPGPEMGVFAWSKVVTSKNITKYKKIERWLLENSPSISMPPEKYKNLILYTGEQYNDLLGFMNQDLAGPINGKVPDGTSDMLQEIDLLFLDKNFQNDTIGGQTTRIKKVISRRTEFALEKLERKYPELLNYKAIADSNYEESGIRTVK